MKNIIRACGTTISSFPWALTFFFCLSCVSLDLPQKDPIQAKKLAWSPPGAPFVPNELPQADQAWQVPSDGTTISFHSDCSKSNESTLEEILTNLVVALDERNILRSERIIFNGRAALKAQVKGSVDGVKTQLHVLVFKKNNCVYNLAYAALEEYYSLHQGKFEKFLTDFKVP